MIFFFSEIYFFPLDCESTSLQLCHLKIASENCRLLLARLALKPLPSSILYLQLPSPSFSLHPLSSILLTVPEHRAGATLQMATNFPAELSVVVWLMSFLLKGFGPFGARTRWTDGSAGKCMPLPIPSRSKSFPNHSASFFSDFSTIFLPVDPSWLYGGGMHQPESTNCHEAEPLWTAVSSELKTVI